MHISTYLSIFLNQILFFTVELVASNYLYHYSQIVCNILRQMIYDIYFVLAIAICHLGFVVGVAREAGCVHHIRST